MTTELATAPAEQAEGASRRRITQLQFYRLCKALEAHAEHYRVACPTTKMVCEVLSKQCDFPVSPSSLEQAKEATGVSWGDEQTLGSQLNDLLKKVARLEEVVENYVARLNSLANTVQAICDTRS